MSTTFFDEIRALQAHALENASPSSFASEKFRRYDGDEPFRDWAAENATAAFRRFYIEQDSFSPPLVTNGDVAPVENEVEIVVAYPQGRNYGAGGYRAMRDVIREDRMTLHAKCGVLSAGKTWPAFGCYDERVDLEDNDDVSFLVMRLRVAYWEDYSGTRRDPLYLDGHDAVTVDGAVVYG